ncbi:hypothetical protein BV20DRAFT_732199 [Pilatotrama ljubarskyi]|nr:hypothetical protein BV20DRAFT_732199 [Pilatotrama ljubarskyi]
MIRSLEIHVGEGSGGAIAQDLPTAMKNIPHLRSLVLIISDHRLVQDCIQNGLLEARFPALEVFHTSLSSSPELLHFIQRNSTIVDLALSTTADQNKPEFGELVVVPNLRKLRCNPLYLHVLAPPPSLTDISLPVCTCQQFQCVTSTLGKQLRRLQVGELGRLPGKRSWPFQYILARFSRLEHLEVVLRAPKTEMTSIDFLAPGTPPFTFKRQSPLTIAWMVREELLRTKEQDTETIREVLDRAALQVLRNWAPYVGQILYGHRSRVVASVSLSPDQTSLVHRVLVENSSDRTALWYRSVERV